MERPYGTGIGEGTLLEMTTKGIFGQVATEPCGVRRVSSVPEVSQTGRRLPLPCASRALVRLA